MASIQSKYTKVSNFVYCGDIYVTFSKATSREAEKPHPDPSQIQRIQTLLYVFYSSRINTR